MKLFRVLMKLWRLGSCDHMNVCRSIVFEDSTELNFCARCGRLLWLLDEDSKRHNPHLMRDRLEPRVKS